MELPFITNSDAISRLLTFVYGVLQLSYIAYSIFGGQRKSKPHSTGSSSRAWKVKISVGTAYEPDKGRRVILGISLGFAAWKCKLDLMKWKAKPKYKVSL
ncbi:hypothetical protein CCMA1212_006952 [Trichoderma ghanense]|uniref:Uncharacterized protein n=1 Tax=Trichoderma ghanense TaxID=65468 RepID=A0ABY2GZJ6_9HYPO